MTDKGKLAKQRGKGTAADRLLNDQAFTDAFNKLEATFTDAWRQSRADEQDVRDNAYYMLRALWAVREGLKRTAATGRVAAKDLMET